MCVSVYIISFVARFASTGPGRLAWHENELGQFVESLKRSKAKRHVCWEKAGVAEICCQQNMTYYMVRRRRQRRRQTCERMWNFVRARRRMRDVRTMMAGWQGLGLTVCCVL